MSLPETYQGKTMNYEAAAPDGTTFLEFVYAVAGEKFADPESVYDSEWWSVVAGVWSNWTGEWQSKN